MCPVPDPGQQLGHQRPAGPGRRPGIPVGRRALGGHRVRVQQIPWFLRYEAHASYEFRGRRPVRYGAADPYRSGGGFDQPDQGAEQGGLSGSVPAHQRDRLAGGDGEVDPAERLDRAAPDGEGGDLGHAGWGCLGGGVGGAPAEEAGEGGGGA